MCDQVETSGPSSPRVHAGVFPLLPLQPSCHFIAQFALLPLQAMRHCSASAGLELLAVLV